MDPSEGRGFNFHTLAKKAGALIYDAPPPSGMHGGVCECIEHVCMCAGLLVRLCSVFVGLITRVC